MGLNKKKEIDTFNFKQISLQKSKEELILALDIDNKLSSYNHLNKICRKASQKVFALSRILKNLETKQKYIIFIGILRSQFSYCQLT